MRPKREAGVWIRRQLDDQEWRCAYPHDDADAGEIKPGDTLALAYDGQGIVHLACAPIGVAPERLS